MYYCTQKHPDDEQIEDIPDQFDSTALALSSHYQSNQNMQTINLMTNRNFKKSSQQFINKNQQYLINRNNKLKELKQQQNIRVLTECTFHPQVNRNKSKSKSMRNMKQFLESQKQHTERINTKNQQLKKTIQTQAMKNTTFSPKINAKKQGKNKENVHQRLYKTKNKSKDTKNNYLYEQSSHSPQISKRSQNIVRNLPIDQLLYEDAKRRAQRQLHKEDIQPKKQRQTKNYNQEKYIAQKLLKDYRHALDITSLKEKTKFTQDQITILLNFLGYTKEYDRSQNPFAQQQKHLIQECYKYLDNFGVTQINFYVFLLAIGGIYNLDLNNQQLSDVLVIDEKQGHKIHSYFDILFRNRLNHKNNQKASFNAESFETFKPQISSQSHKLAIKRRQKMIEKTNVIFQENDLDIAIPTQGISHSDLLVIHNMGRNLELQKVRKLKQGQKDPECTFQPNHQKFDSNEFYRQIMKQKCLSLYEDARIRQRQKEQSSNLPTFRTNNNENSSSRISKKRKRSVSPNSSSSRVSKMNSYLEIKDVDKSVERMIRGRQQRVHRKQLTQRGQKPIKKWEKSKTLKTKEIQKSLLLDADIMIDSTNRKILIYEGEQDKIDKIVGCFCQQYKLDHKNHQMLLQKLSQALKQVRNN